MLGRTEEETSRLSSEQPRDVVGVVQRYHEQVFHNMAFQRAEQIHIGPVDGVGELCGRNQVGRKKSAQRLNGVAGRVAFADQFQPLSQLVRAALICSQP